MKINDIIISEAPVNNVSDMEKEILDDITLRDGKTVHPKYKNLNLRDAAVYAFNLLGKNESQADAINAALLHQGFPPVGSKTKHAVSAPQTQEPKKFNIEPSKNNYKRGWNTGSHGHLSDIDGGPTIGGQSVKKTISKANKVASRDSYTSRSRQQFDLNKNKNK